MAQNAKSDRAKMADAHWAANKRQIIALLIIWFAVSYIPPLFINGLNEIVFAGFPLGYYMGSQGSLIVYVLVIFYYSWRMNKLDEKYGFLEEEN